MTYSKIGNLVSLFLLMMCCEKNKSSLQEDVKIKSIAIFSNEYHFFILPEEEKKLRASDTLFLFKYEEYDSLGNLIEDKLLNGDISYHKFYKNIYNSSGKLIKRYSSNIDDFRSSSIDTFIYDNNNLIEKIQFDQEGEKFRNVRYEYDNIGNKVSEYLWDRHSVSNWIKTSFYYKNRLLKKEKGQFYYKNYIYNNDNLVVGEFLFYDSPDTIRSKTYKYNSKNQLVLLEVRDHKDNSISSFEKSFNKNGFVSKVVNDNETFTYKYEYF